MADSELEALRAELARTKDLVEVLMTNNPDGVIVLDAAGSIKMNAAVAALTGVAKDNSVGIGGLHADYGFFRADGVTRLREEELGISRAARGEPCPDEVIVVKTAQRPEGVWLRTVTKSLPGGGAVVLFRDVSEKKKLEDDLVARNAALAAREHENIELIERLRLAVDELSTPVLEVWDDVLALPIVGVIDTQRCAQMVERVLQAVVQRRSRFVIVDLTGVEVIDTSTADRFLKLARAVQLLGAECIFTGIKTAVAQTLVQLGIEFGTTITRRNLKGALELCMARPAHS